MKTELLAWLINATVATSIACVAVLVLRKPMQRWLGAEIAYRLWIVLPLAALAAFFSLPKAAPVAAGTALSAPVAMTPASVFMRITTRLGSVDADGWLLAIWLLGACALLAVLVWQQRRFVARLRLRESGDGSWRSAIADVAPAVLGVLRQKLVLPECFETEYSDDEQRLVLAHERMHQQRHDPWALATSALLRTVFWFNPIVHFAAGRFRRDVELACDSAVLRAYPGSRRRYAVALFKSHVVDGAIPVGCLWHQTQPMKERIMLLKHALPTRHARIGGAILLSIVALGTTGIAVAGHDTALDAASALAEAIPVQVATAPPAPPALPTIAEVAAPPAPPTIAELPAPPTAPAAPAAVVRPAHPHHVQLASASAAPVSAAPAAMPAVASISRVALAPVGLTLSLAPVNAVSATGNDGRYTVDQAYMATVDRAADQQGVKVIWVNPPETRNHD